MDIQVRNGCKSYVEGVLVLENLNLNVKSGTIYALLGASGCGKTTLLSCIVGLRSLDSGQITVLGFEPGEKGNVVPGVGVGYMPQTMSLSTPITITETFTFYGKLYEMDNKAIKKRINFLSNFLQLPDLSKKIQTLSGGQLRRVSLGVALIHEPPLLLLDEPTVGLDPLLRESIWKHLTHLVKTKRITIMITTHYSEEAKSCDTIGIMRRGCLIAEQSPENLLAFHNSQCLESTVLQLCRQDEANARNKLLNNVRVETDSLFVPAVFVHHSGKGFPRKRLSFCSNDLHLTMAMVYRIFILYLRIPGLVIAQVVIPLVNVILSNHIIATDPLGLTVSFVSEEWNSLHEQSSILDYCERYKANGECFVGGMDTVCKFFNQFSEQEIDWVSKSTEKEALISVQRGKSVGYVNFPVNYSEHFNNRLLFRINSDNETIDGSTISIRMDMSNAISGGWLIERFVQRYSEYLTDVVKNCDVNSQRVQIPLKFHSVYGGTEKDWSWATFMRPFLIVAIMYLTSGTTGALLSLAKKWGIVDRWTVAGVKFRHIVFSVMICDSCVMFVQIAVMFSVVPYFYEMRIKGSWFLAMLIVYLSSLSGLVIGVLLGMVCNHEMEYVMIYMLCTMICLISSGGLWPFEAIPLWYRWICQIIPVSMPIQALRSVMFKGWGLAYSQVWSSLAVSMCYIVGCIVAGVLFHVKRK